MDLTAAEGDALVLRVDPRGLFANAQIDLLEKAEGDPPMYLFRDDGADQPSRALYSGLRAATETYSITWERR